VDPSQPTSVSATKPQQAGDAEFNPAPPAPDQTAFCPKCEKKLIDPSGLGWCRSCGYCKSLEDDKARVPIQTQPAQPRKASLFGMAEFGEVMSRLPAWTWVLVGGAGTGLAVNVLLSLVLPEASLSRALVATGEIAVGLLLIFVGQTWALCLLAPDDDKLHFKDAVLPGRLWAATVRKLPETRGQVWLVGWGLVCILSAILVVGGLTHWLSYLPKKAPPAVQKSTK
jgi:hypothetical protein